MIYQELWYILYSNDSYISSKDVNYDLDGPFYMLSCKNLDLISLAQDHYGLFPSNEVIQRMRYDQEKRSLKKRILDTGQ